MFLLQFPRVFGRKPSTSTAADRNSEGDGLSDEDIEDIGDITRLTPIREEEPETTAAVEEPQRKAKSKGKGKSAGNGDSTDTLVETLLKRADKASEERKAMMQPKSTQEKVVNQFCSYLSTQLNQIKPELWFEFTMACQRLVHTYVTRSASPSASTSRSAATTGTSLSTEIAQSTARLSELHSPWASHWIWSTSTSKPRML